MDKQQEARAPSCGIGAETRKARPECRGNADSYGRHDLARLRIERNRATRHARAAIAKFTYPQ